MIYPEDKFKTRWDLFISVILIFTCFVTPVRISFVEEDTTEWTITLLSMDAMFFIDMLIIFNSAFYTEEFTLVQDRKAIAKNYIKTWFAIDLLAILPIEFFFRGGGSRANGMIRIARMGKLYKLVKLMRLFRILKVLKQKNKLVSSLRTHISFGPGFERLMTFVAGLVMSVHILACIWVMQVNLTTESDNNDGTWLEGIEMGQFELYLTSFYYAVTTITTVGYGDVSITSQLEKILCIIIMLGGCITFAFASGSLASIIQQYDDNKKIYDD